MDIKYDIFLKFKSERNSTQKKKSGWFAVYDQKRISRIALRYQQGQHLILPPQPYPINALRRSMFCSKTFSIAIVESLALSFNISRALYTYRGKIGKPKALSVFIMLWLNR
jgi:hypothetical protein